MIDAECRSEECYSRLSLAYDTQEEKKSVSECVENLMAECSIQADTYTTKVSNGKEVLVIEYGAEDNCREAGDIFEKIIKTLNIKVID